MSCYIQMWCPCSHLCKGITFAVSHSPWRGLPVLPPDASLAGDGEGADLEALLVLPHPGPACLGADLLPAPHPEAGAEERRTYQGGGTGTPVLSF